MLNIEPTGAILGATVLGLDASKPIPAPEFGQILTALGRYGMLRLPAQHLTEDDVRRFSRLFGDLQGPSAAPLNPDGKEVAAVGILSNIKENGK